MSKQKEINIADRLFRAAIKYDVNNPERFKEYISWLLSSGRKEMGIEAMRKAVSLHPERAKEYITFMTQNDFSDKEMFEILPERVEPYLFFGDYLLNNADKKQKAEDIYLTALEYLHKEKKIQQWYFYKVYKYYMKEKRYDDALNIMQKAIEFLPDDVQIRLTTADLYKKIGIDYRAKEEYEKALILDPENRHVRKKLKELAES